MALNVPQPTLTQDDTSGVPFSATKPIKLACGPVLLPDDSPLQADQHAIVFGYHLYRRLGSGVIEAWQPVDQKGRWVSASLAIDPEPLALKDDVWQMLLVAVGQTDSAGADKFATEPVSGFPRYFVRCVFEASGADQATYAGTSVPSDDFTVIQSAGTEKAGLAMDPADAAKATEVRMYLKRESAGPEVGTVKISRSGSAAEIEITVAGSTIRINSQGDIEMEAAPGRAVSIRGDTSIQGDLHVSGVVSW